MWEGLNQILYTVCHYVASRFYIMALYSGLVCFPLLYRVAQGSSCNLLGEIKLRRECVLKQIFSIVSLLVRLVQDAADTLFPSHFLVAAFSQRSA
jgi:hypothetical protein